MSDAVKHDRNFSAVPRIRNTGHSRTPSPDRAWGGKNQRNSGANENQVRPAATPSLCHAE